MKIRYYIYIDESKVNSRTGMMPIYLIFKTKGKMFKFSTGLSSSVKFSGLVFPKSETNARAKTMRLTKIATAVDEYLLLHADNSLEKIKSDVRYIITGEDLGSTIKFRACKFRINDPKSGKEEWEVVLTNLDRKN